MRGEELFTAGTNEDFQRHPTTSAPYVNDPHKVTQKGRPARVQYGRPSNFGAQIEDRFNLIKWSERNVLVGCTLLSDEAFKVIQGLDLEDPTDCQVADTLVVDAKEQAGAHLAAERGTFFHLATTLDRSEADPLLFIATRESELDVPAPVTDAVLDAWARLLERYYLRQLAVETKVVDDVWRLAGTLDRIVECERDLTIGNRTIPAGTVLVLDIKTGRLTLDPSGHPQWWNTYSVQIASYAHSLPYVIDGLAEERAEWPWPISQRHALIAHLDVGNALLEGVATAQLIYVDLVEGFRAGNIARMARDWQKSRSLFVLPDDPPVATTVKG